MDTDSSTAEPAPPGRRLAKLRRLAWLLAWCCLGPATVWTVAALYFDVRVPWLRAPLATTCGLGLLAVWLWGRRPWKLIVTATTFVLVLAWWLSLRPSNDRAVASPDCAAEGWRVAQCNRSLGTERQWRHASFSI